MTDKSKARIAVVGAGLIGRKHIDLVRRFSTLDAVIDPSSAASSVAAELEARWYADLDEYLSENRPDGVVVASPNALHLPHGQACLMAGVPVLIEKPLADSYSNALELAELSAQTKVPILVGHHRRHSPLVKAAKSAIEDGELGRIASVTAQFWLYKPDDYFDAEWRTKEGGGPTYINLIHDIDLLRHFCGEVVGVQAMESHSIRNLDVEDTAAALLEFKSGTLGTITVSDTVASPWSWELTAGENPVYPNTPMACYMLGGTEASLSIPDMRLWRHTKQKSWWAPIEDTRLNAEREDPVEQQFLHFLRVIAGLEEPLVSASEGAKTLQVLDAIKNAALHGRTQVIDFPVRTVPGGESKS